MYPSCMNRYMFDKGDNNRAILHLKQFLQTCPYVKNKPNYTAELDESFRIALSEFQRHHRLRATGGLDAKTYATIGGEMNDLQLSVVALHDPTFSLLIHG